MPPLISIILPAYNCESTLSQAMVSCLEQTHEGLELIVIDDASTDDTPTIIEQWVKRDARVRLCHTEKNLGVAEAFQLGLEQAQGDLIARMDADDINHPQRLEKQAALLEAQSALDAASCLITIKKRDSENELHPADDGYQRFAEWVNGLTTPRAIASQRFVDQPLVNPSMLMRRRVFKTHQGFRRGLPWAEDYDFWLRLLEANGRIAKVEERLFTWTDHPHRLTRNDSAYSQQAFIQCKAHYLARLPLVRKRGVALCGAGPIGKSMARFLQKEGVTLHRFYEVHPRRIGETIHGAPVLDMTHWHPYQADSPVVLGAVGQPGRRQHLLDLALARGHEEGLNFFSTA